ncbi:MAG: TlpA family protein disulfide reductase [Blastocatellia bacterium]|nr:TlpA family protein disulfide reductase [Blastocatellia bacterium]
MTKTMPVSKRLIVLAFTLIGSIGISAAVELVPKSFRSGSLAAIAAAREGKPFMLHLWSINCSSCRGEMDVLAKLVREHPKFDLVLIAADAPGDAAEAQALLAEKGLGEVECWVFGEADAQRLRYEIDSGWHGELPRSYFYDPAQNRIALSGVLKETQLEAWIAAAGR